MTVKYLPKPYVEIKHPDWSISAVMYEVNIRQYTKEGTFFSFSKHLDRLQDLGIDIIWLMPIHPIGIEKRKGTLGSYYSIKNFRGINPEFGNEEDFRQLVKEVHKRGMHIIIDWVANHSSWDNDVAISNPEWYLKNQSGNFCSTPWFDWDDIIEFDFSNTNFRQYMTETMKYWLKEFDIDGFRCDAAGFVPLDFWENARVLFEEVKPVFLLAEWESRDLHKKAFNASYAWGLWDKLKLATQGGQGSEPILTYIQGFSNSFPHDAFSLMFTENHDKNSCEGTTEENFGNGLNVAMAFTLLAQGMPLIHNGQEAGLNRSLLFFDKDEINWIEHPQFIFLKKIIKLKHENKSLWNGCWGGKMEEIKHNKPKEIIVFGRRKDKNKVLCFFNFSGQMQKVKFYTSYFVGTFVNFNTDKEHYFENQHEIDLNPWDYMVFIQ